MKDFCFKKGLKHGVFKWPFVPWPASQVKGKICLSLFNSLLYPGSSEQSYVVLPFCSDAHNCLIRESN